MLVTILSKVCIETCVVAFTNGTSVEVGFDFPADPGQTLSLEGNQLCVPICPMPPSASAGGLGLSNPMPNVPVTPTVPLPVLASPEEKPVPALW